MNIILPKESHGRKLDFVILKHPRTLEPAKFLVDKEEDAPHPVFELTRVGSDARSALVGDSVYSDASMVVATPLHPLFLLIPVLFDQQQRALPLDFLLNLSAGENTETLDEGLFLNHLTSVCQENGAAGQCLLSLPKLKAWLDGRVQRLRAGLPPLVRSEVVKVIQPLDPTQQPSPELVDLAETYAASSMLATSWLAPSISDWYLDSCDFSALEAEVKRLDAEQIAFSGADVAGANDTLKRADTQKPAPPAKRAKTLPQVKNNSSILDMFKKARPAQD